MSPACQICGASFITEETCQDYFNTCQLKEIEQPAYYAVHHLSVQCYMLQHNHYSRQGWLAARELLEQFLHHGLTPQLARRQNRLSLNSRNRNWSLTRGEKLSSVEQIAWSRTIAGVRLDRYDHYCADVKAWAESILSDSAALAHAAAANN